MTLMTVMRTGERTDIGKEGEVTKKEKDMEEK